jgi:hypothetical protein
MLYHAANELLPFPAGNEIKARKSRIDVQSTRKTENKEELPRQLKMACC